MSDITLDELQKELPERLATYVRLISAEYPELKTISQLEGASLGALLKIPKFGRKALSSLIAYLKEEHDITVGGHTLTKKATVDGFKSNRMLRDELIKLKSCQPTKTLRDEIAIAAMQGILSSGVLFPYVDSFEEAAEALAIQSYGYADAMLKERV